MKLKQLFLLSSFFVTCADVALPQLVHEVIERASNSQSQSLADESGSSCKDQVVVQDKSRARKRMSAGKIFGIVVLVLLGAAALGALIGFSFMPIGWLFCYVFQ